MNGLVAEPDDLAAALESSIAPPRGGAAAAEVPESPAAADWSGADTLADSVAALLVMTVLQRVIGFGRGMLFCRWLNPEQLGLWDVAYGFLNLAGPLAVLGLPGSFGRYVEYYRQRGQLRTFLRRMALFSLAAMSVATIAIALGRDMVSQLIFNRADLAEWTPRLACVLGAVIAFNSITQLLIALRLHRAVNQLQFLQSLSFALCSVALFHCWRLSAESALVAFGVASLVCSLGGLRWLVRVWRETPTSGERLPQGAMWSRVVPFALWMWVGNLLYNLFDLVDRYMLLHWSGLDAHAALRLVGNYHTSRIVPVLLMSVAALLGSMLTPHLSRDWEAGRREAVSDRLNLVLKLLALVLFLAGVGALATAPALFRFGFADKFAAGLEVLPWTLTYCAWFGLFAVAQNYLWCAERAGRAGLALFCGLVVNVGLNLLLLPRWGLHGAVWAVAVANCLTLALVYGFSAGIGMRVHRGAWLLSFALIALAGGWPLAAPVAALLLLGSCRGEWLFDAAEKRQVIDGWREYRRRAPARFRGVGPASSEAAGSPSS